MPEDAEQSPRWGLAAGVSQYRQQQPGKSETRMLQRETTKQKESAITDIQWVMKREEKAAESEIQLI